MIKMKNSPSKVLVIGATGAMGQHLVPQLLELGYRVDAMAAEPATSTNPALRYICADAKDRRVMRQILSEGYDGIVDFMIYNSGELVKYLPLLLDSTGHYIYLSSYRVYDNLEHPIRETSPRLLDAPDRPLLCNSDDYSIFKARGENVLRALPNRNWTIIRPAITYSLMRYQLVTLEAPDTVGRAAAGKAVVLPEQSRQVQATMSWGGDVARMIAGLLFNDRAVGEAYTTATSEHHTWGEIADYYLDICKLKAVWVDQEDYLGLIQKDPADLNCRWQLELDRRFDRIIDNSKVLAATGIKPESLMPLYDGLKREISRCPADHVWPVNRRMDDYLAAAGN